MFIPSRPFLISLIEKRVWRFQISWKIQNYLYNIESEANEHFSALNIRVGFLKSFTKVKLRIWEIFIWNMELFNLSSKLGYFGLNYVGFLFQNWLLCQLFVWSQNTANSEDWRKLTRRKVFSSAVFRPF